jgi:hypothetical protein
MKLPIASCVVDRRIARKLPVTIAAEGREHQFADQWAASIVTRPEPGR